MTVQNIARNQMSEAMMRVASGQRINSAADDPAGLAIVENMTAQIGGLDQGVRNTADMQAMINTAEGGLDGVSDSLVRIRELSVQALNDTNSPAQRAMISNEINQLAQGIQDQVSNLQFNGTNLLDGSVQNANTASGPDGTGAQVSINDMSGIARAMTAISREGSFDLRAIDDAIAQVAGERANLGAMSNRMDYTARANTLSSLNLVDARSRIADADIAREMSRVNQDRVMNEVQILMQQNSQNQAQNNNQRVLNTGM
ncbi:MAG: flagellin [Defluviitaleaceae bacterium]|nr:flagellin [Defluviitaleaceae bacterium]